MSISNRKSAYNKQKRIIKKNRNKFSNVLHTLGFEMTQATSSIGKGRDFIYITNSKDRNVKLYLSISSKKIMSFDNIKKLIKREHLKYISTEFSNL